jgi:hypothetical protein
MKALIDEVLDTALDVLERDEGGASGVLAQWLVANVVHKLNELQSENKTICVVEDYAVCRVGSKILLGAVDESILSAAGARLLATALLRAAEAADNSGAG